MPGQGDTEHVGRASVPCNRVGSDRLLWGVTFKETLKETRKLVVQI